ncbi:MAG: trigger factor [Bryobacterales bacterium]|nr:trigger factor [Bryobacterales bacterium]
MALVEGCKHAIEVVIPASVVEEETGKVAESIRARAHIQGFRPGKAPLSMIRARYGREIRQEALENLLPKYFREEVEKDHLDVVGSPNITDIQYESGQDVKFKAEFEVAPEVELQDYRGVAVPYEQPSVSDADVEERIEQLRKQKADYVNLDPKPIETGEVAMVDLHSVSGVEGEPIHAHDMQIELGAEETIKEFSEHIVGMSPGDEKIIAVTYPEEYGQERLAGKTVEFRVNLKNVQKKELPELNDEFAKDLGDFQTIDELKDVVRRNALQEREMAAQRAAKDAIVDKLVESHEFPVPEAYLDRQAEIYIDRVLGEQASRGVDVKNLKLDPARVKEATRDRATKEIKASILLERISEREAIAATQDEVDAEVNRFAKQNREPVAAVRKRFEENGTLGRIAHAIRTEKVLNFLFENARKEASAAPAE